MNIRTFAATLCMVSLFLLSACGDDTKETTQSSQGTLAAQGGKETSTTEANPEMEKWNGYVAFGNKLTSYEVSPTLEAYFKLFDPSQPYSKPGNSFVYPRSMRTLGVSDPKEMENLADAAIAFAAKQPQTELDRAVAAFAPVMKELWVDISDADEYYSNKNYVDDSFALGEKLHNKIMAAFAAYGPAYEQFSRAMDARDLELIEQELGTFKEQGKNCRWASLRMIVLGRKLMNELNRQEITGNENIRSLDLAKFRPFYDDFAAGLKDLEAAAGDADALKQEGIPDYAAESMVSAAVQVKKAAATFIEESQKPPAKFDPSTYQFVSTKNLLQDLNMMVNRYNQLDR